MKQLIKELEHEIGEHEAMATELRRKVEALKRIASGSVEWTEPRSIKDPDSTVHRDIRLMRIGMVRGAEPLLILWYLDSARTKTFRPGYANKIRVWHPRSIGSHRMLRRSFVNAWPELGAFLREYVETEGTSQSGEEGTHDEERRTRSAPWRPVRHAGQAYRSALAAGR